MQVGVVGKPSAGKSTFFKAATLAEVEIANYPFTTIKPNSGVGYVRVECADKFFNVQCNPRTGYCINHIRFVPIEMIDVAGLVPGAHLGKGRGNQFLDDLRQADVLIHVVDISGSVNENGEPVEALSYDPLKDVKFLEDEIDFWYLGIIEKGWEKFARQVQQEKQQIHKALAKQLGGLGVNEKMMEDAIKELGIDTSTPTKWSEETLLELARFLRKKTKPMLIAANKIDVPGADKNYERMKAAFPDYIIVPCSAESEVALREAAKHSMINYIAGGKEFSIADGSKLNDKQKKALDFINKSMLAKFGNTGIQQTLDIAVFELLNYIAIFPGGISKLTDQYGRVLPDCFLLPFKSTALDFAYKLHTDLGDGFIRAIDVKTKMTVGKEHLLKHGDVVEIVSRK